MITSKFFFEKDGSNLGATYPWLSSFFSIYKIDASEMLLLYNEKLMNEKSKSLPVLLSFLWHLSLVSLYSENNIFLKTLFSILKQQVTFDYTPKRKPAVVHRTNVKLVKTYFLPKNTMHHRFLFNWLQAPPVQLYFE